MRGYSLILRDSLRLTNRGLLNQEPLYVWALYKIHPGIHGKLIGVFSSANLAKNCALIQPPLQGDWTPRETYASYIWIAPALDIELNPHEPFYFSVEEIQVDRLASS